MPGEIQRLTVPAGTPQQRLDTYLAASLGRSRSQIARLLRAGQVKLAESVARASHLVQPGDQISVITPASGRAQAAPDLPVVYEDADLLVVDKPAGLTVHPAGLATHPTVVDFARTRSHDPDPDRPGIVHRLDRDTSGLLIVAKNPAAKAALQARFKKHAVAKTYQLLVIGTPNPPAAVIDLPLDRDPAHPLKRTVMAGGRPAITAYRTLATYPGYSFIEAKPQTGRTHQLRVHFATIGHPVAGDTTYGPGRRPLGLKRQFLHAAALEFETPAGHKLKLASPLPPELASVLAQLKNQL